MVKIQRLVLKNFKSFRNANIPFANGFTAIVGSNGSGKTNILDALMFVMGATSLKSLRAGRLSELVNNTAIENYAKVDLTIKHDSEKYEISRMIDKQGKSIYRLNEQRKTRNEISSLLSELGVRPNGHNIVVQGDSTRIIEMSPEERRQIIDELAGLQEFDEKKAESLKNLEKVETKIKEANIVFAERENYLEQLEKDRQAAMEFDNLEKEKKQATATILHIEIEKITEERKKNSDRLFKIGEEQNALQEKVSGEEETEKGLKDKSEELNQKILQSSEKTFNEFGMTAETKKAEKMVLQEKIETKKHLVEKNSSAIYALGNKAKGLMNTENSRENDLHEIEMELPKLKKQLEILRENKQEFEERALAKEQTLKQIEQQASVFAEQEATAQKNIFEKRAAISALRKEIEFKKQWLQEAENESEKLKGEIEKKEAVKKLLDSQLSKHPEIENELRETIKSIHSKALESKGLEARQIETQSAAKELKKQIANCPVCESKLSAEKKKRLLAKKETELKSSKIGINGLLEITKKLEAKKQELEEKLANKNSWEITLSNFKDLMQKHALLKTRIAETRTELGENVLEGKERSIEGLEKELAAAMAKKREKQSEAGRFKASIGMEKISELANSVSDTQTKIGLLEQKKNHWLSDKEKNSGEKKSIELEIEELKKASSEMQNEVQEHEGKLGNLEKEISALQENMKKAERAGKGLIDEKRITDEKISRTEQRKNNLLQKIKSLEQQINELKIENSKSEVRLADLKEEFVQYSEMQILKDVDARQLQKRSIEIDKKIVELGAINKKAIESFNELKKEVEDAKKKVETLEEERLAVLDLIEKIEVKRTNFFMNCFNTLNENFSKMFFSLFAGQGQLSLSNPENPLDAGLLIEAKHKGSNLKNIDSMSGGEKTLAALAFLFAIQLYEPAPFYAFDEADAALDKENSAKIVGLIQEMSRKSQFVVITHNDPLIQNADQVIGVALNKQKSSVIGLKLKDQLAVQ